MWLPPDTPCSRGWQAEWVAGLETVLGDEVSLDGCARGSPSGTADPSLGELKSLRGRTASLAR